MKVQGKVGIQELSNGSEADFRQDNSGAVVVAPGHFEFERASLDGKIYIGANLGGTPVTTQAGLSATTPALTLYNPVGSGVDLVLIAINLAITSAPAAAASLMLAYNLANAGAPTSTTDATITSTLIGGANAPIGKCFRVATLPAAPLMLKPLGGPTGASAIGGFRIDDRVNGAIIVTPGVSISIQSTSAAAVLASFMWEERKRAA